MTFIDLKPLACPIRATSPAVGRARVQNLEGGTSAQNHIGHRTELRAPWLRSAAAVRNCSESVRRGCVDSVNRVGVGLGHISAGLGRIAYLLWSSQHLQGMECSSSPTSGTRFPPGWGRF
jgi:hypothetical protein